jgi:serine/threonine-protein kinase SRPK3
MSISSESLIMWTNKLFDNRYILIKKLGHGSFSSVWLSFDIDTSSYFALKIQNIEDYDEAEAESKVYKYISTSNSKYLMNIIRTFDYCQDDDDEKHFCMVMDVMSCSSHDLIKSSYKNGLPFNVVICITKQILYALNDLHAQNIIHRDVKPENILIVGDTNLEIKKQLNAENIVKKYAKSKADLKKESIRKKIINEIINVNISLSEEDGDDDDNDDNDDDDDDDDDEDNDTDDDDDGLILKSYCNSKSNSNSDSDDIVNNIYNALNLHDIKIKLGDMGHCVLPNIMTHHEEQPNYYLAPELILKLDYSTSVDMWALGCTIYELLTNRILFDSEDYHGNTYRHHLYMVAEKLGMFPKQLIEKCPEKDVFFNKRHTCIKGYRGITFLRPIWKELQIICKTNNLSPEVEEVFINFMMMLFKYNPSERLSSNDALAHHLFTLC